MSSIRDIMASILCAALTWLSRRRLPQTSGRLRLPGLRAPVEVIRDRWGVPHIYAASAVDAVFAQGYVHAQDRLWQMDFSRRLVAGRLAEVLGAQALPADRWIRTIGMRRVAEQEAALLDPELRAEAEAYAAGVNALLAQGRLPIEFTLLGYRPEPWTPADSISWGKMMAWSLSVNWESELLRARLIECLGADQAAELEPAWLADHPSVVPPGVDYSAIGQEALERARAARRFTGPAAQQGLGSNNWVLAGQRTATGRPLLANDMHLLLSAPCIWYENHLAAGDLDVTGVSFPGLPGVVAGHNGHVAWGFTNGFPDVQDLYVEHLRRLDDGRVQYEFRGQWLQAQVIREEIRVKGGPPVIEEVIITRHGPTINSLAPDLAGEQPLALRWTALDPSLGLAALHRMNRARNCVEFREALRDWVVPIQNTVYADTEGNIAYSFPGRVPIRAAGDGRVPVPGWTGEYEWVGYIPYEQLPHLYNPPQGYVATANNRVVRDDYPYFITADCCAGDRVQRIVELIEAQPQIDVGYIERMHQDQVCPTARAIAQVVGQLQVQDPDLADVVAMLRDWDGRLAAGSAAASVYEVLVRRLPPLLLTPKIGEDLAGRYCGRGPTPVLAEGSILAERSLEWLLRILATPNSHWFDLGHGETRDDVLRLALREAVDYLRGELGPEREKWGWGRLHRLTCAHTLGQAWPLAGLLNRGPYPVGGDAHTVCASGPTTVDPHCESLVGPPFRFIADLGDLRRSRGVLLPGQSGQPGSPHYDDQVAAWLRGEYRPMLYAREDVEAGAVSRLHLSP